MTTSGNVSQQLALSTNNHDVVTPGTGRNQIKNKSLFGANGFTFFDFLDIINPLQHIPVISTIYRSITGDQIDPGSRIAGATLFGGPLGTVLTSMDLAIKDKTGQDITEHATNFFSGNLDTAREKNLSLRNVTAKPTLGAAMSPISLGTGEEELFRHASDTNISLKPNPQPNTPNKFGSAGMTAIPVANKAFFSTKQTDFRFDPKPAEINSRSTNKMFNFMSQESKKITNNVEVSASNKNFNTKPQDLTPRFSTKAALKPNKFFNQNASNLPRDLTSVQQGRTIPQENWLINAMVMGLGKYEAATKLANNSDQKKYSVNR